MMRHYEGPDLMVGERVVVFDYPGNIVGEIVEHLDDDYVRVRWSDFCWATTHRAYSLKRVSGARDWEASEPAA